MSAREERRSLFGLIGSLPGQIIDLVSAELERLKNEIVSKLKHAGIGLAFLVLAAFVLFFSLVVLVFAGIFGLAVIMPAWAAALIVAGVLLVLTVVFGFIGVRHLGKGVPIPDETLRSIRKDIDAVRGTDAKGTPQTPPTAKNRQEGSLWTES